MTTLATSNRAGWVLSPSFDAALLGGSVAMGLTFGALAGWLPLDIKTLVLVDTALLGYPHVIATFTRAGIHRDNAKETALLFGALPLVIFLGVVAVGLGLGEVYLATLFFYWQSFHYIRQSYGIARIYARKAPQLAGADGAATLAIYVTGFAGILFRSYQGWPELLGMPLSLLPVPYPAAVALGAAALGSVLWWLAKVVDLARQGRLPLAHTLYVASHLLVFGLGYWLIPDNGQGWLVINAWHNTQYLLVVWMYHHLRLRDGAESASPLMTMLARQGHFLRFFGVCFVIAYVVYGVLDRLTAGASFLAVLIVYQTINFHHYLVDGLIWKLRRPKLQSALKLAA